MTPWPRPGLSFVGRVRDLQQLDSHLAGGQRVITLWGPAGVGKTRLAIEVATRHRAAASLAVRFIDLAEARSLETVLAAAGAGLGLAVTDRPETAIERLGRAIAALGPSLVLLDNFEQVVGSAPEVIGRWLDLTDSACFLVTSRVELGIRGEALHEVRPLEVPASHHCETASIAATEAVQLFVDRARMHRTGYRLDDSEALLVVDIVRRLDGLPLAIELAAAQIAFLGTAELQSRLAQRFEILVGGPRDAAARQQTLRAAIGWSWDLLAPIQQDALAQCASFRGGFMTAAFEALIDLSAHGAPSPVEVLRQLRSRSLVAMDPADGLPGEVRYRMLESVRAFAQEQILTDRPAALAVRRRHAIYYSHAATTWAAALRGPDGPASLRRLALEFDNLLYAHDTWIVTNEPEHAVQTMIALDPIFARRGPLGLQCALMDRTLAATENHPVDAQLLARAYNLRAVVRRKLGRADDASADHVRARELAQPGKDGPLVATVLLESGHSELVRGRADVARVELEQALRIAANGRHRQLEAEVLVLLALLDRYEQRWASGRQRCRRALQLAVETGDRELERRAWRQLGTIALKLGHEPEFRECAEKIRALPFDLSDRHEEALLLMDWGVSSAYLGRFGEARASLESAIALFRELGEPLNEGSAEANLGVLEQEEQGVTAGSEHHRKALALYASGAPPWRRIKPHARLGAALAAQDRLEEAEVELGCADELAKALAPESVLHRQSAVYASLHRGYLDLALARRARDRGDTAAARSHVDDAHGRLRATEEALREDGEAIQAPRTWVGFAARLLARTLDRDRDPPCTTTAPTAALAQVPPEDALVICPEGSWFKPPGKPVVDLTRRGPLRRILTALAAQQESAEDVSQPWATLLHAGWPGERVGKGAANRVHVAIATLRRLGLGPLLERTSDGYRLARGVRVIRDYRLEPGWKHADPDRCP